MTWGTIALNTETGVWTFTADADALNSLDDGESEVLSLQGMVSDAATTAGTDTRTFTITLNGAEDAATVTVADASSDADGDGDAATFDITATAAATATAIATLTVTDPDDTYAASDFSADDTRFEITKSANVYTLQVKAGAAFTYDAVTSANNTLSVVVTGPDSISETFTITILEAPAAPNTAPTLVTTSGAADLAGTVTEDVNDDEASGSLTLADADASDTADTLIISTGLTSSALQTDITDDHAMPADPTVFTAATAGAAPADVAGAYGTFSFTLSGGVLRWTYRPDNTDAAVQALAAGQEAYEKLAVRVTDDGGASSATQIITVTITGANDVPIVNVVGGTAATATIHGVKFTAVELGSIGNDYTIDFTRTAGTSNISFSSDTFVIYVNSDNATFTSQNFVDLWNAASPDITRLATAALEGASQSDSAANLDGSSADFAGGADADHAVNDVADDDVAHTVTGNFSVVDPDNGEAEGGGDAPTYAIISGLTGANRATVAGDATGYTIAKGGTDWGTIVLDTATGEWTFTANAAALNSLDAGESEVLSLQAQVTDDAGITDVASFTITLNGAADAPGTTVADATSNADTDNDATTFSVTETNASVQTDIATFTITDPDTDYTAASFSVTVGGSADTRFEVVGSGKVYTLRIKAGQTFDFDETPAADNTLTVTVAGPDGPFTFTGTIVDDPAIDPPTAPNNAPTATPPAAVTVDEAATKEITAAMLGYADSENDALVKITITAIPTSGKLQLNGVDVTDGTDVTAAQLAANNLVYIPASGLKANADGSFSFTVNDGTDDSAAATLTVTVTADDDAPVFAVTDVTGDADGDTTATTFDITETTAAAVTAIATITVTDPDDTYAASDFSVSDTTRFEITKSNNVYTLRVKEDAVFTFDAVTSANNVFTVTVSGPNSYTQAFTGTILEEVPVTNHIFYLTSNADLTAARTLITGTTDTAVFGDREDGFYVIDSTGLILGDVEQAAASLNGPDTVYIGDTLHGTEESVTAAGGNDVYKILAAFTAGATDSQSTTHVTINDSSQPTINTYELASLAAIASYDENEVMGTLVLTFTNGAKLTIRGVRDDMFVIGEAEAVDYAAFTAAVDTALGTENNAPTATPPAARDD